jgi:hypothetical protein
MWTLAQWQRVRRVDHLTIHLLVKTFHPRFRDPAGRPNLKVFDPMVSAFWLATNDFDKVSVLGEIVARAAEFIDWFGALPAPQPPARYLIAVQRLLAEVQAELSQICGALGAVQRSADIVAISNNHALAAKVATINVFYVAAVGGPAPVVDAIDQVIDAHIVIANGLGAFTTAGLTIRRQNAAATVITDNNGHSILATAGPNIGKFQEDGRSIYDLILLLNAQHPVGRVDVVYLEEFAHDDVQGFTARPASPLTYSSVKPAQRPVVVVRRTPGQGGAVTHPTTLAHEMGHALTECGQHSARPNDLMASGDIRNAVNHLSIGNMAWFRDNPYTV